MANTETEKTSKPESRLVVSPGQKWLRHGTNSDFIVVPLSQDPDHDLDWLCARFMLYGEGRLLGAQIIPYSREEIIGEMVYQGYISKEAE